LRFGGEARPLLVASDVDGCLLDEETYSPGAAAEALAALEASGIPLVLCSSKTRAEMEAILELGTAREILVARLGEMAAETGAGLVGFSTLSASQVSRLTGLPEERSRRALERLYDEPFLLEGPEAAVAEAAARRGLRVTRGARFLHLTGPVDKGHAFRRLLQIYADAGRRFATVGLGDARNDLPLLQAVDRPIVVPRPGGIDAELARALPGAERAPAPGPTGWGCAVLAIMGRRRLPAVDRAGVGSPHR
jgi:mannosyl-3-phosphoglycerate phosphatase